MRRLLTVVILFIITAGFITGCGTEPKKIDNATVISKSSTSSYRSVDYCLLIEKDGQKVQLRTANSYWYNAIQENSHVDVTFDLDSYYITSIEPCIPSNSK